jgi:hypothetical protein
MHSDPDFSDVFDVEGEDDPCLAATEENIDHIAAEGSASSAEGDTAQEPAAPAAGTTGTEKNDLAANAQEQAGEEGKKQSAEENAAYAKIRRKYEAERNQALSKAKEDAKKELDQMIADTGMVNPYTNRVITSKAEMDAYFHQRKQEEQDTIREELANRGVPQEHLRKCVDNHPDVIAAKNAQAQLKALRVKDQNARNEKMVLSSLAKISEDDKSIQKPQDLLNHPRLAEISEKFKKGYSLEDAYYIVNRAHMNAETAKKAEQATRNKVNSKNHLRGTHTEGSGGAEVPADLMGEFHRLAPEMSDAQIRRWYQKDKAKMAKRKG